MFVIVAAAMVLAVAAFAGAAVYQDGVGATLAGAQAWALGQATAAAIEKSVENIPFYDFVNNADSSADRMKMMLIFFKQEVLTKVDEAVYELKVHLDTDAIMHVTDAANKAVMDAHAANPGSIPAGKKVVLHAHTHFQFTRAHAHTTTRRHLVCFSCTRLLRVAKTR